MAYSMTGGSNSGALGYESRIRYWADDANAALHLMQNAKRALLASTALCGVFVCVCALPACAIVPKLCSHRVTRQSVEHVWIDIKTEKAKMENIFGFYFVAALAVTPLYRFLPRPMFAQMECGCGWGTFAKGNESERKRTTTTTTRKRSIYLIFDCLSANHSVAAGAQCDCCGASVGTQSASHHMNHITFMGNTERCERRKTAE